MFCAIPTICFSGRKVLAVPGRFSRYLLVIEMRVRFGDCVLDTDTRELFRKEKAVRLPPTAFRLLEVLVESRPKALSKDQIHEKVWPGVFISEGTLASAVSDIRIAIGDTGKKPRFIRTVHGFGYAFSGKVSQLTPLDAIVRTPCQLILPDQEIPLTSGENVLGRDLDCQVRINDSSVSRRHARIIVESDSAKIQDLGSKNGTFVAGSRLHGPRTLADDDEIRVGDILMTFRLVTAAKSTVSAHHD